MFKMLEFIERIRPKPLKRFQRWLKIEDEWGKLKNNLWPHRAKILTVAILGGYPLYQPRLKMLRDQFNLFMQTNLEQTKPSAKISESLVKEVVVNVLRDPKIRNESALLVENAAKRQIVVDAIANLLVESLKDANINREATSVVKGLAHNLLLEQAVKTDVTDALMELLRDPEVRFEAVDLMKAILVKEDMKDSLGNLLREGFKDERLVKASAGLIEAAFIQILQDKELKDRLRAFSYFLFESEGKNSQNTKGIINTVMDRVIKGYRVESNENQLKKTFKEEAKEDLFESIDKRKEASQDDSQSKEFKAAFF